MRSGERQDTVDTAADRSTESLLATYAATGDPTLRDEIIQRHEGLVRSLAHKFARPGVSVEDLVQTAWVALIGALDRFDPSHETRFSTYAVTCMAGEIKRYFRDRTWGMRVPRELQELSSRLPRVQEELSQKLQRSPLIGEVAEHLGVSEETVLQAMELGHAYQPRALEERREVMEGGDSMALGEAVGRPDPAIEGVVEHAPLQAALATLDERKQRIIRLRFFQSYTQEQVAAAVGLSQMHVSRLERAALLELRGALSRG